MIITDNHPCVTSLHLLWVIVFVTWTHPFIPCANLPSSLPYEWLHVSFTFGCLMWCLYSMHFPVSSFRIAPANLCWLPTTLSHWCQIICLRVSCAKSCIDVQVSFLALVLSAGLSNACWMGSSSWVMKQGRLVDTPCGVATMLVFNRNMTTGGPVVEVTIFWGSGVVLVPLVLGDKSCVLVVLVPSWFTLVCPLVIVIVLLFFATQASCHIVNSHRSWLMLVSPIFDFVFTLSTWA